MAKSFIVLGGSNRSDGNSKTITDLLHSKYNINSIELSEYVINHYDYSGKYPEEDQFIALISNYVLEADHLIWLTPMYWYSMSGIMKQFLDRWTDLLKTHKEIGRQFRGKEMSLVYHSNGERLPEFEVPFKLTANYLGITYRTALHLNMSEEKIMIEHDQAIDDYYQIIK